jgi:capsular exopolysaccharide synthesis family protein
MPPADADLRARLVTGGADAVSLEQYRRLAAALHDAQVERGLKTVMVTSALAAEGKTLTSANLALTLSESYARRVLVIDADLRWPSLHEVFGVKNVRGLSEALADPHEEPALVEVSSRLTLMTAGKPVPTPLAGLSSPRMGDLLQQCAAGFDWVLVDTSPVGLIPDGQVLARLIGAVILVINAGSTPSAAVERAVADLGPECILGTVLNRVEEHRIPEAGYYSRYGGKYGSPATSESE